jgi:hypothetical protein
MTKLQYKPFEKFDPSDKKVGDSYFNFECPACKGHGGFIYIDNAYGPGKHFKGHCNNCDGRGWVNENSSSAKCIHDYIQNRKLGNCYYEYVCTKCGTKKNIDSGD